MKKIYLFGALYVFCALGSVSTVRAASISFNPPDISISSVGLPPKSELSILSGAGGAFAIDVTRTSWASGNPNTPLTFKFSNPSVHPAAPVNLEVSLRQDFYGEFSDTLQIPIKLVESEGVDRNWGNGETKTFAIKVSVSRPCTNASCNAEPNKAICAINGPGEEPKFWRMKVKDYKLLAGDTIAKHNTLHFNAYLNYERPITSLWESFGVPGPITSCCPCDASQPKVCSPIKYSRWGPKSTVATAQWDGEVLKSSISDPTGAVSISFNIPAQITDTFVHVNAAFLEYVFNNQNSAPTIAVKDNTTGKEIVRGQVSCYNVALGYGVIRFIDRKIPPIRFEPAQ